MYYRFFLSTSLIWIILVLSACSSMKAAAPIAAAHSEDGFSGVAVPVSAEIEARMRKTGTWKEGCPVPVSDLAYVTVTHWGYDDKPHTGELVVHRLLAADFIGIFRELYDLRFPIERMRLIEEYGGSDDNSMAENNSSSFNCREAVGRPGIFSKHSYGSAIEINTLINPYISPNKDYMKRNGWDGKEEKKDFLLRLGFGANLAVDRFCLDYPPDCVIYPPTGAAYTDRTGSYKGIISGSSEVVKIFARHGFDWAGAWPHLRDYQHFEMEPERIGENRR